MQSNFQLFDSQIHLTVNTQQSPDGATGIDITFRNRISASKIALLTW